jgi:hypothetical protein
MFDVQILRHRGAEIPEEVLASIAGYYRRVTTTARPMNRLVAAAMLATIAAIVVQIAAGDVPGWAAWTSLALAVLAIGIAAAHTVPSAIRLGSRTDDSDAQGRLARSIYRDHLVSFAAIISLLAVQLAAAS